jgi:hypothetical protein
VSLRDRLAAKQRRRVVVSVEIAPMGDDQATRVTAAQAELLAALTSGGDNVEALREVADAAQAENRAEVGFTACGDDIFEKVAARYPAPDGTDGGFDWHTALPVVAALCADDEDLQDDEWWAEQFASGTWGHGEKLGLWQELLALNTVRPAAHVPKD